MGPDPVQPGAAPAVSSLAVKPVGLLAAIAAVVGAFLDWFGFLGSSANSFDIAAPYLFDHRTTASDTVTIGAIVAVLAGLAALMSVLPTFAARDTLGRVAGALLLLTAAAFLFQLSRTASDGGVSFSDLVGLGPFVTAAAGAALLSGK